MKKSAPLFDSDSLVLGAFVSNVFIHSHRLAYAQVDADLRVVQASPNFATLTQTAVEIAEGQSICELFWEFVGAEAVLQAILRGDEPELVLERINRELPDGSVIYLTFRVLPLKECHPMEGLLVLVEDVTASGQLEQQLVQDRNQLRLTQSQLAHVNQELERLSSFKSFMLSMAAHDLRSPLSSIYLYADLINGTLFENPPEVQRERLHHITDSVERLTQLIIDLLSWDQIEQGRLTIHPQSCDLGELIRKVLHSAVIISDLHGQKMELVLPSEPFYLWIDPDRMHQVIYNLVDNAMKHTPSDGLVLIRLYQQDQQAVFQVTDTGSGITDEQRARLFQMYNRTDQSYERGVRGTGLGLFIVKTLVEAHGGSVSVESQVGAGTTFTVRLPLVEAMP
jgi:signal transduction histidine kinase